jgi:hypothetical protein
MAAIKSLVINLSDYELKVRFVSVEVFRILLDLRVF